MFNCDNSIPCNANWSLFPKRYKRLMSSSAARSSFRTLDSIVTSGSTLFLFISFPQWGAADAEIKVPSDENTELKGSPFQAWSRSVYSHACCAYCWGCLPCLFPPFRSIQLHVFQKRSRFFPVLAVPVPA